MTENRYGNSRYTRRVHGDRNIPRNQPDAAIPSKIPQNVPLASPNEIERFLQFLRDLYSMIIYHLRSSR